MLAVEILVATEWEMFPIKDFNSYSVITTATRGSRLEFSHQCIVELVFDRERTESKYRVSLPLFPQACTWPKKHLFLMRRFSVLNEQTHPAFAPINCDSISFLSVHLATVQQQCQAYDVTDERVWEWSSHTSAQTNITVFGLVRLFWIWGGRGGCLGKSIWHLNSCIWIAVV